MKLDVVVPTYNRCDLMRVAVLSLFQARLPSALQVRILVVDNNSNDRTHEVVRELQRDAPVPLIYILERNQGSSSARNAGIHAGSSDLIGFIDDDETVEPGWFEVVAREFEDADVSFIGGP